MFLSRVSVSFDTNVSTAAAATDQASSARYETEKCWIKQYRLRPTVHCQYTTSNRHLWKDLTDTPSLCISYLPSRARSSFLSHSIEGPPLWNRVQHSNQDRRNRAVTDSPWPVRRCSSPPCAGTNLPCLVRARRTRPVCSTAKGT